MAAEWIHISIKNPQLRILGCAPDLGDSCFSYDRVALFCSPGSWQSVRRIHLPEPGFGPSSTGHSVHGGIAPFRARDPFPVPENKVSFWIKRLYIEDKV
jgi:hypothetical protein